MTDRDFDRRQQDLRLQELEVKIDKLSKDVEDLVAAWKAANWVVSFVKWIGGISAAITAIYTMVKLKG